MRSKILVYTILLFVTCLIFGCSSVNNPSNSSNPNANTPLSVTPSSVSLIVGKTQQFTATLSTGQNIGQAVSPSWVVTGSIGTIDATGLFTATNCGIGTIEASYNGYAGKATVSITSGDYFPHKDGNSWIYSCTSSSSFYPSYDITNTLNGTYVLSNNKTVQIYTSQLTYGSSTSYQEGYYYFDQNGVFLYGTPSNPTTEASTLLSYPLTTGKTWNIETSATCEVIGTESVTVPAGTYNAVKIKIDYPGYSVYSWFAEDVGQVKAYADIGSINVTMALKSKNF